MHVAFKYGAKGVCLGSTKAYSVTQSNSPGNPHKESARAEAAHKKRSRQRSSQRNRKVKNGRQDPGGESSEKNFGEKTLVKKTLKRQNKMIGGAVSEIKKTESRMLISKHPCR
jgi:hypothetical protein